MSFPHFASVAQGSYQNRDIGHVLVGVLSEKNHRKQHPVTLADQLGYWPGVGSVVAIGRFSYGLTKTVASVIAAVISLIFRGDTNGWFNEANEGLEHMGRAVVEFIPIAGGLALFFYDRIRLMSAIENGMESYRNYR